LVLQIDDMDERVSDWASDNTPLFGSTENADDASDHLSTAAGVAYFATAFMTPSGKEEKPRMSNKIKGLSVGGAAVLLTHGTTRLLKKTTGRIRPDESDDESFISGHTSTASSFTTLARRNLDYVQLSRKKKALLKAVFTGIAALTGWARVEAEKHFFSDVLVGYAAGYLISATINDAFLSDKYKKRTHFRIEPSREGVFVGISLTY
jgi:membrane-associated phospholipid phosphatase